MFGWDSDSEVVDGDDRAGSNRQSNFTLTPEFVLLSYVKSVPPTWLILKYLHPCPS